MGGMGWSLGMCGMGFVVGDRYRSTGICEWDGLCVGEMGIVGRGQEI